MDLIKLDQLIESVMNKAYLQGKHLGTSDAAQKQLADNAQQAKSELKKFIVNSNS